MAAYVYWGDASGPDMITTVASAAGQITFDGSGTAIVNGTHTYTTPGVYAVRTTFYFDSTDLCTVDSRLTVADGTLAVSGLAGASFLQNTPSNTEVAVVSGTAAMTPDLAAEIAWGDGATTPALIVPDTPPDGQCGVWTDQMHTFGTPGSQTIAVTVCDKYGTTASTTVATNTVASSNILQSIPYNFTLSPVTGLTATVNMAFPDTAVPLATFAYPAWGDNNDSQAYLALITWGSSGNTSAGAVMPWGGGYAIYGDYTFAQGRRADRHRGTLQG